ncbi:MAG TPA: phosphoribosylglycinamide formyltransferase [Burkholderiaceae bacterium]|nr:phosphoribosylglycinamide formyltransferase [Burkholderiaceae bacterium]
MKNVVVLISGRGSNMEALLRTAHQDDWAATIPARISAVISNRPHAGGLAIAHEHGVATEVVDHTAYLDRETFDAALARSIDAYAPDLVVLAGFMRILTAGFVERYAGRLLNIHPSLLPAFPGLATHRRALETGVKLHGATVHFVTSALDLGPIVIQGAVPVMPSDDENTLAARVLNIEHRILPTAVRWYLEESLSVAHDVVVHREALAQWTVAA